MSADGSSPPQVHVDLAQYAYDGAGRPQSATKAPPPVPAAAAGDVVDVDDDSDGGAFGDAEVPADVRMQALLAKVASISDTLQATLTEWASAIASDTRGARRGSGCGHDAAGDGSRGAGAAGAVGAGAGAGVGVGDSAAEAATATVVEDSDDDSVAEGEEIVIKHVSRAQADALFPAGKRLTSHQLVGLNWAWLLYAHEHNGLLADQMGLGKTVQSLAILALIGRRMRVRGPHLVVAPASTLESWRRHAAAWLPSYTCMVYHGSAKHRGQLRREFAEDPVDILVTSFSVFERAASNVDRAWLKKLPLHVLVLDEAHSAKNVNSARYQRLQRLRPEFRLMLSGTPVQNRLEELFTLLRFALPRVLREDDFRLFEDVDVSDTAMVTQVRALLQPFVLRRTKEAVLADLPPKTIRVQPVAMTQQQAALYAGILRRSLAAATTPGSDDDHSDDADKDDDSVQLVTPSSPLPPKRRRVCGDATPGAAAAAASTPTPPSVAAIPPRKLRHLYTELRKAASHPALSRQWYATRPESFRVVADGLHAAGAFGTECSVGDVMKELATYSDFRVHQLCLEYGGVCPVLLDHTLPHDFIVKGSGKFLHLAKLLPDLIAAGHKSLIFSQWTQTLDVLEPLLQHLGVKYVRFDGSTPVADRATIVDRFTTDADTKVFLLSTRAGGLGVTLTAADTVICHDLDFNPHNDRQAEDRVHRMGQQRPVTVYRLVSAGTVEESIHAMQQRKQALASEVLQEGSSSGSGTRGGDGDDGDTPDVSTTEIASLLQAALEGLVAE